MTGFDEAAVRAEVRAEFDAYEQALVTTDVDALLGFFREDDRAVRLLAGGGLYGFDSSASFRKCRDATDMSRDLSQIRIEVFAEDFAVATCEYTRNGSGMRGAQSQVWQRRPEGWRIVSAHVSLEA